MASLKEIVTKAVLGKAKKKITEELIVETDIKIDTVLGCWVINHSFTGEEVDSKVIIDGSYDVNIWYAYENNTKTSVFVQTFIYRESINVKKKIKPLTSDNNEAIIRCLKVPSVANVELAEKKIKLKLEKELGVELVGDMKVRINVEEDYDDYEEEIDEKELDIKIKEDYIDDVNQ